MATKRYMASARYSTLHGISSDDVTLLKSKQLLISNECQTVYKKQRDKLPMRVIEPSIYFNNYNNKHSSSMHMYKTLPSFVSFVGQRTLDLLHFAPELISFEPYGVNECERERESRGAVRKILSKTSK